MRTVRRIWAPSFDAMASPLNAICPEYATIEDDLFELELAGRCVFVNPAYATKEAVSGSSGIGQALHKLVNGEVRRRGCTLVALLPCLPHTAWYASYVDQAHEVHLISGELTFPNPYLDLGATPPVGVPVDVSQLRAGGVAAGRAACPPHLPAPRARRAAAGRREHAAATAEMPPVRSWAVGPPLRRHDAGGRL